MVAKRTKRYLVFYVNDIFCKFLGRIMYKIKSFNVVIQMPSFSLLYLFYKRLISSSIFSIKTKSKIRQQHGEWKWFWEHTHTTKKKKWQLCHHFLCFPPHLHQPSPVTVTNERQSQRFDIFLVIFSEQSRTTGFCSVSWYVCIKVMKEIQDVK